MSTAFSTTLETAVPSTETWSLDASHTQVGFAVKHLMISTVKGRFTETTGTVTLDPARQQTRHAVASPSEASTPVTRSATRTFGRPTSSTPS